MTNFNRTETESITKFLANFVDCATKTLSHNLDKDVFKKIEFYINSCSEINSLNSLMENNLIYKIYYSKGDLLSTIIVLIPEELAANISDVLMGGSGEGAYNGSLSELEINAIKDLAKKIFGEMERFYKNLYTNDFGFSNDPLILTKEKPQYENEFSSNEFDFLIDQTLKINEEKEYKISTLFKTDDLRKSLIGMDVFNSESWEKTNIHNAINFNQLSDVKIDITAELGRAKIPVKNALEMVRGSIVKLDTINDSDIKVFANNIEVARAQVVAIGESFALRITKIITPEDRMKLL